MSGQRHRGDFRCDQIGHKGVWEIDGVAAAAERPDIDDDAFGLSS
jgi:hypothetical protein